MLRWWHHCIVLGRLSGSLPEQPVFLVQRVMALSKHAPSPDSFLSSCSMRTCRFNNNRLQTLKHLFRSQICSSLVRAAFNVDKRCLVNNLDGSRLRRSRKKSSSTAYCSNHWSA